MPEIEEKVNQEDIRISKEYLTFLHDMLSESIAKLEELFGGSASMMMFEVGADQVNQTLRTKGKVKPGLEGAIQAMTKWGMKVAVKEKEGNLMMEITCPFAEAVHPNLATDEPKCPLGTLVLGAARTEAPGAGLKNDLTKTGATFTILNAPRKKEVEEWSRKLK